MAELLTGADLAMNMETFYASTNKVEQDAYLLRLIRVEQPKRLRTKDEDRKRSQNNMNSFYLMTNQGKGHLRVCKATFCSVLGISLDLVTRVAKHFGEHKEARREGSGGRRCTDLDERKRNAVVEHNQSFKCKASHCSRKDSPGWKYLPYELSVAKMYRMLSEHNHLQISYSLHHSVFSHNSLTWGLAVRQLTCVQHAHSSSTLTEDEKKVIAAEFILHRRRQRQFYDIMNMVRDTTTVCFDMMENLVLPRTPIRQAYYSRQLYLHVFGVVVHRADGFQRKEDIHLFTWLESENGKDSNMIASALWHFLRTTLKDELTRRQELRLFSDSCYGQNKNMNMLACYWPFVNRNAHTSKLRTPSLSEVTVSSVFGRVEQEIRRNPTILLPDDYLAILSNHGRVHCYGNDWNSLDFKAAAS